MSNIALYIGFDFVMFSRNVTLALITVASTPVAFLMLAFIVKMARSTPISSKRGWETQRLHGREYFWTESCYRTRNSR